MSRSSATASPSTRARSASSARACSLPCLAARSTAAMRRRRAFCGDHPLLAGGDQHRLVADRRLELPGAAEQIRVGGQAGDGAGAAGRRMHLAADRQRVADGFAGVHVQAGRRVRRPARAQQQLGARHGVDVRCDRHRKRQAIRRAPARRARPSSPAAGGRGSRSCCRRRRRRPRRPTAGGGGASGSGSDARCRPATRGRPPGRRAASASRRRRACGRTGRWPRCWWSARRCGCRASGTARG